MLDLLSGSLVARRLRLVASWLVARSFRGGELVGGEIPWWRGDRIPVYHMQYHLQSYPCVLARASCHTSVFLVPGLEVEDIFCLQSACLQFLIKQEVCKQYLGVHVPCFAD